jgi:ribosome-associated toxin RatA of RatAB toxin-antitoxin module
MHTETSLFIKSPMAEAYTVASDLKEWPKFLSHYCENRFLSSMPWGGIVKMHCKRTGLDLKWISVFIIDAENQQLRFEHLSYLTRGMNVVWQFEDAPGGVRITISHDLESRIPVIGNIFADQVVGNFVINYIAPLTLEGLRRKLEAP